MRQLVRRLAQSIEAPLVDRFDRAARHRSRAAELSRPRDRQLGSSRSRAREDRRRPAARARARRRGHRADDRRDRDGEDGGAQSSRSRGASTTSSSANTDLPPGALIFDALTFTLATGEAEFCDVGGRNDRRHPRDQARAARRADVARRFERVVRPASPPRAPRSTRSSCITASKPDSTARSCIPKRSCRTSRSTRSVRELCDDLVFNRRPDALTRLIEHFEASIRRVRAERTQSKRPTTRSRRSKSAFIRRSCTGARTASKRRSTRRWRARTPVDVLNEILLPAMKDVGDRFGRGELILPFVLQCAEVMKKAVAHLEQFLEKTRRHDQRHGRARDRLRRRARHRQKSRPHDSREQRLHRARSRQTSADEHDPREGRRGERRCDRPFGAARFDQQADADLRARSKTRAG